MAPQWTIYYDHDLPKGGKATTTVLLDTGSWTEQDNCNRRNQYAPDVDPVVIHRPRLFTTRGLASCHKKTRLSDFRCYRIAKYTGPTDPEARPIRKIYELTDQAAT